LLKYADDCYPHYGPADVQGSCANNKGSIGTAHLDITANPDPIAVKGATPQQQEENFFLFLATRLMNSIPPSLTCESYSGFFEVRKSSLPGLGTARHRRHSFVNCRQGTLLVIQSETLVVTQATDFIIAATKSVPPLSTASMTNNPSSSPLISRLALPRKGLVLGAKAGIGIASVIGGLLVFAFARYILLYRGRQTLSSFQR